MLVAEVAALLSCPTSPSRPSKSDDTTSRDRQEAIANRILKVAARSDGSVAGKFIPADLGNRTGLHRASLERMALAADFRDLKRIRNPLPAVLKRTL
jgi:hypothetical protein